MGTWDNEPLSSLTHLIGLLLSIAGLILIVIFGLTHGNVWHVVSFSIFGATLILLYSTSTLYHFVPKSSKAKWILQRIDHSMIFLLIAGTYTPIGLVVLRGGLGWSIFGIIWGLAILGIVFKLLAKDVWQKCSTVLYVVMGWFALIALKPLIESLGIMGMLWLFIGGIFYTVGVIFYALDRFVPRTRWFGMHEIFHLFVMAGSFSHFWLMFAHILYI